jgi:hypothetical protein
MALKSVRCQFFISKIEHLSQFGKSLTIPYRIKPTKTKQTKKTKKTKKEPTNNSPLHLHAIEKIIKITNNGTLPCVGGQCGL